MRLLLVFLLLALVMLPAAEGWRRRRRGWRRVKRVIKRVYRHYRLYKAIRRGYHFYGRDVDNVDVDLNKDGVIDQSEAEKVIDARAAKELLPLADEDGNSQVSVDEFTRSMRELMTFGSDAAAEEEDDADINSSE
ncbi:uncharacterized protein LOC124119461 [Haliotis rufescens]|uniref:uncharacterized protein LOC124119461 n=1 Tax=Haliotis rufescens TaxID=6454 RepID=UPI00201F77C0|nr:uncharacterized protein LOC124119461 [Haliotis rufescens]